MPLEDEGLWRDRSADPAAGRAELEARNEAARVVPAEPAERREARTRGEPPQGPRSERSREEVKSVFMAFAKHRDDEDEAYDDEERREDDRHRPDEVINVEASPERPRRADSYRGRVRELPARPALARGRQYSGYSSSDGSRAVSSRSETVHSVSRRDGRDDRGRSADRRGYERRGDERRGDERRGGERRGEDRRDSGDRRGNERRDEGDWTTVSGRRRDDRRDDRRREQDNVRRYDSGARGDQGGQGRR